MDVLQTPRNSTRNAPKTRIAVKMMEALDSVSMETRKEKDNAVKLTLHVLIKIRKNEWIVCGWTFKGVQID